LLELAKTRPLAGVVEALGSFRRSETVHILVKALSEDHLRPAAEAALPRLGTRARPALLRAALRPMPSAEGESPSSCRARRSALRLLLQIGLPARYRAWLLQLIRDGDGEVAAHACRAYLEIASTAEKREVLDRLIGLLPRLNWLLSDEVEACIARLRRFT
jgi:hypothetical protein